MVRRWSMGNAAAVAEAEADSGVSAGWLVFVVALGGVVGAMLVSELGHRRSRRSSGAFGSSSYGSAQRVQLRPLGGTTSGSSGGTGGGTAGSA